MSGVRGSGHYACVSLHGCTIQFYNPPLCVMNFVRSCARHVCLVSISGVSALRFQRPGVWGLRREGTKWTTGWARMGSIFRPFIQTPFTPLSFAEWAPLMEQIFGSQAACLALTGAGAYLKGIFLPPSSPPRLSPLLRGGERSATDRQSHSSPPTLN